MKNIVLTGFMGVGKNAIGKKLAKELGLKFVNTDDIIEKKEGITITQIFEKFGEKHFRKLEKEIIKKVAQGKNQVISTGGGVVLDQENISNLTENGVIICLWASPEMIRERTEKETHRPLLEGVSREERIKELLDYRKPFYEKSADYIIDTSHLTVEETVEKILKCLRFKQIIKMPSLARRTLLFLRIFSRRDKRSTSS
ncbi:shikimate kinase [bacterium]|nr:shikimate kinase [bacterium]